MLGTNYQYIFIGLFIVDKLLRLIFIYFVVKPNWIQLVGITIVVLISFEELFSLCYRPNNYDSDDDGDGFRINIIDYSEISKSEIINIPMIPQLAFIIVWLLITCNQFNTLLAMPCLFFFLFYLNNIWSKQLTQFNTLNYTEMIPEYISLVAYFGMIIACRNIPNFITPFLIVNLLISFLIFFYHLKRLKQIPSFITPFLNLFILIMNILNAGVELRSKEDLAKLQDSVSYRILNYQLLQKLLQNSLLLIFLVKNYNTISISNDSGFLIIIITSLSLYYLINLYQIYQYYISPILNNCQLVQIESCEDLIRYNNLNRQKLLKSYYISKEIDHKQYQEYIYCLLYNFQNQELHIPSIGRRYFDREVNNNNNNINRINKRMTVQIDKRLPNQYIDQLFKDEPINQYIRRIEFNYEIEDLNIVKIIKNYSKVKYQQLVIISKNMPQEYKIIQEEFQQIQQEIILRNIIFFRQCTQYLNINPYSSFSDLYESQIDLYIL